MSNVHGYNNRLSAKKTLLVLLYLLLMTLIASLPLGHKGWFVSHDSIAQLERVMAVSYEMDHGDYYPRWLSLGCYGKGLPVLNYYSPVFFLINGYIMLLGIGLFTSLKIVCTSLFFLGSWGMFIWTKKHYGTTGALIAATVYTFMPYHFLDIYSRGALPEFAAINLLPFLFHGLDLTFSPKHNSRGIVLTSVMTALIILTHNLSALMIMPFALVYFIWMVKSQAATRGMVLSGLAAAIIGVGLSSLYWVPMIMELDYLGNLVQETAGKYNYAAYFLHPSQWFSFFQVPYGGLDFQLGNAQIIFVVLSALSLLFIKDRSRGFGIITLVFAMFGLFLTISASSAIYKIFSPLQFIQFPYRFLGPATLFIAAFAGLSTRSGVVEKYRFGPFLLLSVAFILCFFLSAKQRTVREYIDVDSEYALNLQTNNRAIGLMSAAFEFVPRWTDRNILGVPFSRIMQTKKSDLKITGDQITGSKMFFDAEVSEGVDILITQLFFPGWKATIDGKAASVNHNYDGFIKLSIPAGHHSIKLWFGTTWPRIAGWIISFISVAVLVYLDLRLRRDFE